MKRYDKDQQETLREFPQGTADRAVVWIDGTGRILDELEVETRIRPGTEGCQLCLESLDGSEAHGAIEFDDRGLPRLLPGPRGAICINCVEWVCWLRHYAGREPVSAPRFGEGDLVLRAGTEEIYRILDARLTGLPAVGIWFPVYRCQRIEVRESSGEILPACLGLEFELADFELQPVPPRYAISAPGNQPIDAVAEVIDLVGETWQAYPAGDRIDECVMHASLYVPEPVTTDKAKRHWDANMDRLVRTVEQEDFPVNERILEGCRSGAQQRIVYARNEPCLVHFHRSIRRALGMPDLRREETA